MSEWDELLERQRQINLQNSRREQEEREREYERKYGTLGENLFKIAWGLIALGLIITLTLLKWIFFFIVFLRNNFFIKWNWYVKAEKAVISACATICAALLYTIFILPIIYLFKWWELWLVIGFIYLNYCYGKV